MNMDSKKWMMITVDIMDYNINVNRNITFKMFIHNRVNEIRSIRIYKRNDDQEQDSKDYKNGVIGSHIVLEFINSQSDNVFNIVEVEKGLRFYLRESYSRLELDNDDHLTAIDRLATSVYECSDIESLTWYGKETYNKKQSKGIFSSS